MKLDALDHPKTNHFASLLGISRPTAIGHLELLWAFTGKMSPQGNLGKWPDGAIARACDWMGDPGVFLEALLEAGLLDADETHGLLVHDWDVHAAGWVRAKLKNAKLPFLTRDPTRVPTDTPTNPRPRVPTRVPTREATIQGKGSEGKGSVQTRARGPALGDPAGQPPPELEFVGKVPPTLEDPERSAAFAVIRQRYPAKAGRGHNWILAERAWGKLIDDGETDPTTLEDGVNRYRAYVDGGGVSSTAYVMGADQFFSAVDRPWSQPWDLPAQARNGTTRKTMAEKLAALSTDDDDDVRPNA